MACRNPVEECGSEAQQTAEAQQQTKHTRPRHRNPPAYTMPCAAGEMCQIQDLTPEAPDGHMCRGVCGGRLHGLCGEVEDLDSDKPMHRICQPCSAAKATATGSSSVGKSTSASKSTSAGKRKADEPRGRGAFLKSKKYVVEDPSDDEIDDGEEFESTGAGAAGGGSMPPPSYADLSTFFGPLEHFAQSCGNDEAGNHLRKARMSFIRAFASKPGRQADMREFT